MTAAVSYVLALLATWLTGGMPMLATTVQRVDVAPDRIVVRFDANVAGIAGILFDRGQAKARQAKNTADNDSPGGARVMLDLSLPVVVAEGRFGADAPALTLAMRTADAAVFAHAAADRQVALVPPFSYGRAGPAASTYHVSQAVPPPSRSLPLPPIYGDDASRPLVVIDPGHGGFDPGAIAPGSGLKEKDVTLRIARAIRDALVQSGRARVALTREDDRFLVLQERYGIARKLHAALFISIHCDSTEGDDAASGATVYTLSEVASDKEAARLAARENRADIIEGVNLDATRPDISNILIDLTQRETMNHSAEFAQLLGREAKPLMPTKPTFHRMASLMVLKASDMPSILFETGYISNPRDAAFIDSPEGRQAIAQAVLRAVEVHFARRIATTGSARGR